MERNGYQSVQVSLTVAANQTIYISTNLVSETYLHAMNEARQYLAAADYDRAASAVNGALVANVGDVDALALLWNLQLAKTKAIQGDYAGGVKLLQAALVQLPDNDEAKRPLADYQQRADAQAEQLRSARLNRPKQAFDQVAARFTDANLFDEHDVTTSKPVKGVARTERSIIKWCQPNRQGIHGWTVITIPTTILKQFAQVSLPVENIVETDCLHRFGDGFEVKCLDATSSSC